MELIAHKRNNCALIAVREVSGKSDEEIFAAVRKHGYKDNRGMYPRQYHEALMDLGTRLGEEIPQHRLISRATPHSSDGTVIVTRVERPTVKAVVEAFPKGTYLVTTWGHVLVVRDGVVVDPNWTRKAGMSRAVFCVREVLNPHRPKVEGFVQVVRPNVRRRTAAARTRWWELVRYLATHERVTPKELLKNTSYRKLDFDWDIKRGNLKIV